MMAADETAYRWCLRRTSDHAHRDDMPDLPPSHARARRGRRATSEVPGLSNTRGRAENGSCCPWRAGCRSARASDGIQANAGPSRANRALDAAHGRPAAIRPGASRGTRSVVRPGSHHRPMPTLARRSAGLAMGDGGLSAASAVGCTHASEFRSICRFLDAYASESDNGRRRAFARWPRSA